MSTPCGNRHTQHRGLREQRRPYVRDEARIRGQLPQAAAERKAGIAGSPTTPPEAPWRDPADKQVIKNLVERIRQDILAEIAARKTGAGEGRRCERRRRRSRARKENPFMRPNDLLEELHELKRRNATPVPLIEMFDALLSLNPGLSAKERREMTDEILVKAWLRLERKDA